MALLGGCCLNVLLAKILLLERQIHYCPDGSVSMLAWEAIKILKENILGFIVPNSYRAIQGASCYEWFSNANVQSSDSFTVKRMHQGLE